MFRQVARRCAGLTGSAISTSVLLRSRGAITGVKVLSRAAGHSKTYPLSLSAFRAYSSEAVADNAESPSEEKPTKFEDLISMGVHENLVRVITDKMGYTTMTPVQAMTIAPALKGTDIVAQARTGTGKTLAFLLPLLQRMINEDPSLASRRAARSARSDDIRGIVLSPTRELAEQIAAEAQILVKNTGLVVQSAVGGTQKSFMLRRTRTEGCHLLVATPGRLHDLLSDETTGIDAPNLAALVLDEADRMLDTGFEQELRNIISLLPARNQKTRQTLLVSATIPDNVIRLARAMVRADDFEFVQTIAENESLTHEKIPQYLVPLASWNNVFPAILELIEKEHTNKPDDRFKAIIYFNTTSLTNLAGEFFYKRRMKGLMKFPTYAIQSKLTQQSRTRAADMFRRAQNGILLSSDVTSRGMDFPDVTHVIQVDVPRDRESYIHRLGRTGRQNKEGQGWLLLPQTSRISAKRMLHDLPLKATDALESAVVPASPSANFTKYHQESLQLMGELDRETLVAAYKSGFGPQTTSREEFVDDFNFWTVNGWGFKEPPAVSQDWAMRLGLRNSNLNIMRRNSFGTRMRDPDAGDEEGGADDAFTSMSRNVRRDDQSSGRSGYGDRSGGGSSYGGRSGGSSYGGRGGGSSYGGRGGGSSYGGRGGGSSYGGRGGGSSYGSRDKPSWERRGNQNSRREY